MGGWGAWYRDYVEILSGLTNLSEHPGRAEAISRSTVLVASLDALAIMTLHLSAFGPPGTEAGRDVSPTPQRSA